MWKTGEDPESEHDKWVGIQVLLMELLMFSLERRLKGAGHENTNQTFHRLR